MAELKEQIAALSTEERWELAALISTLNRRDDVAYQTDLAQRLDDMAAGKKASQTDLERLHERLIAEGR